VGVVWYGFVWFLILGLILWVCVFGVREFDEVRCFGVTGEGISGDFWEVGGIHLEFVVSGVL